MQAQAQQQPAYKSNFRQLTRQNVSQLQSVNINGFGTTQTLQLTQTGFLARVWLTITASVTVGTASGNWATYPPPVYNLLRRVRLYTSENVEIVNSSLWGLWINAIVRGIGWTSQDGSSFLDTNNYPSLYKTNSGALAVGTSTFAVTIPINVMTDDRLMLGLLPVQTNDVRVYMDFTSANAADLVTVPGSITGMTVTVTPTVEFFSIPPSSMDYPDLRFVHTTLEEIAPVSNTGDFYYRPTVGNIFLRFTGQLENNGAQMAPSQINTVRMGYGSQTVIPYNEAYTNHVWRNRAFLGVTPLDGSIIYDFTDGFGVPGVGDPRDFLDSSQQTDLAIIPNLSGSLTNAQLRMVKEQLLLIA